MGGHTSAHDPCCLDHGNRSRRVGRASSAGCDRGWRGRRPRKCFRSRQYRPAQGFQQSFYKPLGGSRVGAAPRRRQRSLSRLGKAGVEDAVAAAGGCPCRELCGHAKSRPALDQRPDHDAHRWTERRRGIRRAARGGHGAHRCRAVAQRAPAARPDRTARGHGRPSRGFRCECPERLWRRSRREECLAVDSHHFADGIRYPDRGELALPHGARHDDTGARVGIRAGQAHPGFELAEQRGHHGRSRDRHRLFAAHGDALSGKPAERKRRGTRGRHRRARRPDHYLVGHHRDDRVPRAVVQSNLGNALCRHWRRAGRVRIGDGGFDAAAGDAGIGRALPRALVSHSEPIAPRQHHHVVASARAMDRQAPDQSTRPVGRMRDAARAAADQSDHGGEQRALVPPAGRRGTRRRRHPRQDSR